MTNQNPFLDQIEDIKTMIADLPDNFSEEKREETASRLEGLNYSPSVITDNALFLRLDKQGILDEVDRIVAMPEEEACALAPPGDTRKCEDLRLQYIKVILFYYEKLILLRQGNADEWDEVDELYVHD